MKLFVFDSALGEYRPASAELVRQAALASLEKRLSGASLSSPAVVRAFLRLGLGALEHEVFGVVFCDAQHRVIEYREMFRGTLTQSAVYPREIVKEALGLNAAAVVLVHNHPSGALSPSPSDKTLTLVLKQALGLVDVRVLDHLIVAGDGVFSFAERGLL